MPHENHETAAGDLLAAAAEWPCPGCGGKLDSPHEWGCASCQRTDAPWGS